jgi:flagella basal body P-ring formation protein FlgA
MLVGALALLTPVAAALHAQRPPTAVMPLAGVERSVPVAAHALPRGVSVTSADYQVATITVRHALRTAAAAESGWVTRRAVAAGEPLIEPAVGPPSLVTSGQPVTFVAGGGAIRLTIHGTAATGGSLGQMVWVRVDARRRLRGVVTAPATVSADTTSLR